MHHIVKGDVYVPTSDVRAYGQFITSRGGVFSQDPAMVFLLTYGPFSYAKKGATIEYLKTGQLRIGSFCLVLSGKNISLTRKFVMLLWCSMISTSQLLHALQILRCM